MVDWIRKQDPKSLRKLVWLLQYQSRAKPRSIVEYKEEYFIMIKEINHQEEVPPNSMPIIQVQKEVKKILTER